MVNTGILKVNEDESSVLLDQERSTGYPAVRGKTCACAGTSKSRQRILQSWQSEATEDACQPEQLCNMDVDVDSDLQCPICLELYTYPIILPCSHVLCRSPCAEHLFDFNFIRCPVCRDKLLRQWRYIESLPRVIALENIIERYKKEQKKDKSEVAKSSASPQPKQTAVQAASNGSNEDLAKSLTY
ncbi:hypothetical protein DPMN_130577 [Dreissena polymorpha]|uniref:RING-type domain-containing protein n=1 Tax=Dreissena polymorpha TaxID=45954 RepID=A0A9D4H4W9_DREPO|nr:hypothetical protein DPMN_130577 [Dreissena polymorpha]